MGVSELQPFISIVVSTRGRGSSIRPTIESALGSLSYPAFELLVVDQNSDQLTAEAVRPFLSDARLRYIRSDKVGLSEGRNLGISEAKAELIAITDDDCEVPGDWLEEIAEVFRREPRAGMLFGNVLPGEHLADDGFIPDTVKSETFVARSMRDKNRVRGLGACLALRRSAWESVHRFDSALGAGAPFRAAEETDLTVKMLLAGYFVVRTPRVRVTHHGYRTWKEGREHAYRNSFGTGASCAKHLKQGHWSILRVIGYEWIRGNVGHFISESVRQRRLSHFASVAGFCSGFATGLSTPIDETGNYDKRLL